MTLVPKKFDLLCAVDFSSHSDVAAQEAADLARRYKQSLLYLCVVPEALGDNSIEKVLNAIAENLAAGARYVSVSVLPGDPTDAILDAALRYQVQLILLGPRGQRQNSRHALGRVAHAVAARSVCPVMIVPESSRERRSRSTKYSCPICNTRSHEVLCPTCREGIRVRARLQAGKRPTLCLSCIDPSEAAFCPKCVAIITGEQRSRMLRDLRG